MAATMPKIFVAAIVAGLIAFTSPAARSAETATPDDTARFLAGMPVALDSPLQPLTDTPAWRQHAHYFDYIFNREDKANLSKIRAFSQARLTEKHPTLLYMFSGPDFLYANAFFPSA